MGKFQASLRSTEPQSVTKTALVYALKSDKPWKSSWFSAWSRGVWLYNCRGSKEQGVVTILAVLSVCLPSQSHSVQVSFT